MNTTMEAIDDPDSTNDSNIDLSKTDSTGDAFNKEGREEIAKNEDKVVMWLRLAVLLVLVGSAVAVSVGLYQYGTSQEESKFETKYFSDARKVHEA